MIRELKGYHVLAIAVGCFSIVIGANLTMLFAATGTFPGLVVENSYVASQDWNDRTAAQQALGWEAEVDYADGKLSVMLTGADGAAVTGADLTIKVGRPTTTADDQVLMVSAIDGAYRANADLAPGRWQIEIATASGPDFRQMAHVTVEAR